MEQEKDNIYDDMLDGQEFLSEQKVVIGDGPENEEDIDTLNEFDDRVATVSSGRRRKKREVALVFDRYYEKAPKTFRMLAGKVLFCCALCVCSMMFLLVNLDMPLDLGAAAWACFGFTAAFSTTFLFVKKRIAIPVGVLACSVVVWHNRDAFWDKLSYFFDGMLVQMNGRLWKTYELVTHKEIIASNGIDLIDPEYTGEMMFGVILVCALFSLIVASSMFRRPHLLTILVPFLAMWAPRMIAERLMFNWWVIPAGALYVGVAAMVISHRDGLAIRHGFMNSYRKVVEKNEHTFDVRTENAAYLRKIGLRGAYNSKYFTLALCTTALFMAAALITNSMLGDVRGIDYTEFYEFVKQLGSSTGVTSPFKSGPMSEYFSDPNRFTQGAGLSITSPGRGEQEIMRVRNSGELPIYLRGDVGMAFNGTDWTSPVNREPEDWHADGLDEGMEKNMLALIDYEVEYDVAEQAEISIDYLCDTSVVFLPAYIDFLYAYSDSKDFELFGDYAVRSTESASKLGSVKGGSYVQRYIGVDDNVADEGGESAFAAAADNKYALMINYSDRTSQYYSKYYDYVQKHYLGVPETLSGSGGIEEYIVNTFDDEFMDNAKYAKYELVSRYRVAKEVADYLRDNYEYSLNAKVSQRNPVMSFLNDVKSGHCALYASAMTMIMRSLDIPARYCTGFIARPNGGAPSVLRSKNLHAWCEVYFDELGWVTFDPTSSVSVEAALNGGVTSEPDRSSSSSESSEPSSSSSSEISSEPSESTDEASDSIESSSTVSSDASGDGLRDLSGSGGSSGGEKVNVLPYVLTVLGILAVIALIVFAVYRIRQFDRNAKKAMKRFYHEDDSHSVYARLLAVLKLCGFVPNSGELMADFLKRSGRALGCNIIKRGELLELIAFGGRELSDTEKAQLGRLLEKIFAAADKKLKLIGKIKLRRIMLKKRVQ